MIPIALIALLAVGFFFGRVELERISVPADTLVDLGFLPLRNSLLATWLTMAVLVVLGIIATARMTLVPRGLQNLVELVLEGFYGLVESVAGPDRARRFFPLVMTIFLFVLTSNWLGLVPGFGTIGFEKVEEGEHHLVPLLRAATTDLNTTFGLALVSVAMAQYFGVATLRLSYLGKFFTLHNFPIGTFVGLLELISEIAKIFSFSFRLFGNIFAGHVLLAVIVFLVPWVAALPFLGLELFVGLIQAFIFAMLTLVFLTMATIGHGEGHEEHAHAEAHGPAEQHARTTAHS
ncbi:MAG: F0F1 ATP synthase subunit A [Chloroflexi bacterium]|nr:F0F1 ATP synthase subunit A [Chloroflexota bacterium]